MKKLIQKPILLTITIFFVLSAIFPLYVSFTAAKETPLLSQELLEPYGLNRLWFNQIGIDANRNKILYAIVEGGTMFIISDDAKLHVIDAETGKSLWLRTLGNRQMTFQEPAVNSRMVAVVNGLELFVFDRRNGKLLLQTSLPGASSTAPEMSENYVYVPMLGGRITVFPLEDVSGPKMEEEGGLGSAPLIGGGTPNTNTGEVNEPDGTANNGIANDETANETKNDEDPVLANITKKFAEVKQSILAEPEPPKKEQEIFLRKITGIPMQNLSFGNVLVKPLLSTQIIIYNQRRKVIAHRESITWITDRGFLFTAGINNFSKELFELQYMVDSSSQTYYLGSERIARREWEKNKELIARPTANQCIPPLYTDNAPRANNEQRTNNNEQQDSQQPEHIPSLVVTGNKEGYVFAVKDRTGEVIWQFAANGSITERIAVIGKDVYCSTTTGGMHALDLLTGQEKWFTPNIRQFVAASQKRIYAIDNRSRLVILDRNTGNPINAFDAQRFDRFLFNIETDRIYVINDNGLIQCLHERQPQTLENILDNKPIPLIRHRLSCKQYIDVLNGQPAPNLYWSDDKNNTETETEENSETTKKESKNETGEDGSLDGNSMNLEIETKQENSDNNKNNNEDNNDKENDNKNNISL
ncbi:MAG: PQQ-binding-like beta-propeller repeat protein [Planctomycetaceae bacterium]|jgi:outer membrane protein assembly factor BamB|nr:PQQ-binding-like beta-propeller repeat protein [Planctomycetaceae bacterium]